VGTRLEALSALLRSRRGRAIDLLALAGLATAGSAIIVNRQAKRAEADHPPKRRFVTVSGARLHYFERGDGRPVVFVHGNGTMLEDIADQRRR
jgi:hypothetical protein